MKSGQDGSAARTGRRAGSAVNEGGGMDPDILDHLKIAVAAAAGGLVRLLFRPGKTVGQTLWVLFACITCGYYAVLPIMTLLNLPPEFLGAVGAAAGFVGLSLAEAALGLVDSIDLRALADRIIGRWIK